MSSERSELLAILRTYGALDEYTRLQQRHSSTVTELKDLERRIETLKKFEQGRSALRVDKELVYQRAQLDLDERQQIRDNAIAIFNANSEALYNAPGRLLIEATKTGFDFDVSIEREGSDGIEQMKVLCYDLMLTQLWSGRTERPDLLIHDSPIFADVDRRQVALALELAATKSAQLGFQYICTLNEDTVPFEEFSPGFNLREYVRLTLTDATDEGGLLGFRIRPTS